MVGALGSGASGFPVRGVPKTRPEKSAFVAGSGASSGSQNKGKKVVVVQGLGYVGAVMAVVCANAIKDEYAVLGVDLPNRDSFWKINSEVWF